MCSVDLVVIFSIKDSGELVDPRVAQQEEAEYYLVYASQDEEERWSI